MMTASKGAKADVATVVLDADVELFSAYPDLLTPAHISELTGFTVEYVRRLCREHKLPAVQVGGRQWFVPKPRFVEYVMGGGE